jgi:tetratricopeptide (TPR) repeat protein
MRFRTASRRQIAAFCAAAFIGGGFTLFAGHAVGAAQEPPAPPAESAEQRAFKEGNALLEQGKYAPALARYKEAATRLPNDPAILWNGGTAAFFARDYATAIDWWNRLKTSEPNNWRVRAKLIQTYQAAGRKPERDAERRSLIALRNGGTIKDLAAEERFCRDQFFHADKQVFAYEHFDLSGERALRYNFLVFTPGKDTLDFRVSLGSYKTTNDIARELGEIKPGQRLFHLDGYYENGRAHKTFGFFNTEPTYDTVRSQVLRILDGKARAGSSSRRGGRGGEAPKKP